MITSKDNSKLRLIRKIVAGDDAQYILLEGVRLAEELLRSNIEICDVLYTRRISASERGVALLDSLAMKCGAETVAEVQESLLDRAADSKTAQGIAVVAKRPSASKGDFEARLAAKKLVIVLHGITNPANLGAILRTVEAAGADGVVTTRDSTDIFSVKALRAGLGANLRLPVWSGASFDEAASWALGNSLVVTAVDAGDGTNYTSLDWKKSRMLVFGSEAHGLSKEELASAEERVMIPMKNDVESLNLSVSCGVILFEALRQREA